MLKVELRPLRLVTTTLTLPFFALGVRHVMVVGLMTLTFVASVLPKKTRAPGSKSRPLIVTAVLLFTFPVFGVIAVLPPSARIIPGRLDRTIRIGAEPRLGIGWRKADPVEPSDFLRVLELMAPCIKIVPPLARALAGDAGRAFGIRH